MQNLRNCKMKRKRKYVLRAIAGIYDCGVYKNLQVVSYQQPQKHTRRNSKKYP